MAEGLSAAKLCNSARTNTSAQDNLVLTRWLATPEKQRRFPGELASGISRLLKEERKKGLPGRPEYLWRAGKGNPAEQNDLFRLQDAMYAVKLPGWIYMVLAESEWSGWRRLRPAVSGIYLDRHVPDDGFDESDQQRPPLPARITGELTTPDALLSRSGWSREPVKGDNALLHHLLAEDFSGA